MMSMVLGVHFGHRYPSKGGSGFVMCLLLALGLPRAFLQQPLTVLTRQIRQVVRANNQSIFNMMSMVLGIHFGHRYPRKSRWLKFCYVHAISAWSPKGIFAAATNSSNWTNKAGCTHH